MIDSVGKTFRRGGRRTVALRGVNLEVQPGELVCLIGPSGCGKSTLLRIVAGALGSDEGAVTVDGEAVSGPARPGHAVPDPMLFPWLTTRKNVVFGPRAQRARGIDLRDDPELEDEAGAILATVGLASFDDAFPHELSGGMRHRAAFARALITRPSLLLMDEPFGGLDAITRSRMHEFLLGMQEQHEITIIFVTHDLEEAVPLGDRVAVMGGQPPAVKEVIAVPLGRPRRAATGAAGLIAVILLWQAAAAILRDPVVLPSATQTARAFGHYLTRPYPSQSRPLWDDLLISLRRILTGFVIGAAAGVALGAAMSASRVLRHLIDPVIEVIRPLPPLAFIPPLIVWFGIGELPKEVLIVLAIIPVVIVATVAGLDEVPDDLRLCARTLGASRRYTLLHVQIRSALPGILVGMRIAMAGAWTSIVAAEMLAATSGIGLLLDSGLRGLLLLADPSRRRLSRAQPARAAKVHSPHTYNYRAA